MFERLRFVATILFGLMLAAGSLTAQERLASAPAGSFSVVVISDTQAYRGAGTKAEPNSTDPVTNAIFDAHTRWIVKNIDRQHIAFVSHVGDIVDKNERSQWEVAHACMSRLHGLSPYGISVGNHDMTSKGNSSLFQDYFPASQFIGRDWYGGAYSGSPDGPEVSGNNANSYQFFTAGGMPFLFLHLECNAPDDVLHWANAVLERYPDCRAMITTHMGWGPKKKPKKNVDYFTAPKGRMEWTKVHGKRGNSPQQMWEKCYRKHKNLFAVFSGDQSRTQAIRAATPGDCGNVVHELLQDYGSGWLRIYRFLPAEDSIDVFTFDPKTEKLCDGTDLVPDRKQHQFRIEYEMK